MPHAEKFHRRHGQRRERERQRDKQARRSLGAQGFGQKRNQVGGIGGHRHQCNHVFSAVVQRHFHKAVIAQGKAVDVRIEKPAAHQRIDARIDEGRPIGGKEEKAGFKKKRDKPEKELEGLGAEIIKKKQLKRLQNIVKKKPIRLHHKL